MFLLSMILIKPWVILLSSLYLFFLGTSPFPTSGAEAMFIPHDLVRTKLEKLPDPRLPGPDSFSQKSVKGQKPGLILSCGCN